MRPYRLTYQLVSPIILGQYPPTLDSLIYAALCSRSGDERWALQRLPDYFQFTDGVPHASALAFGRTRSNGVVARTVPLISGLRTSSDLSSGFIKPYGRSGGYSQIRTHGGAYRHRFDSYRGYWSPYVCFDFCGKKESIHELLDFYLLGIGSHVQIGAGQVRNAVFTPLDRDLSLIDDNGAAVRPLPADTYSALTGNVPEYPARGRLLPPYWLSGDDLVVQPTRVRIYNF